MVNPPPESSKTTPEAAEVLPEILPKVLPEIEEEEVLPDFIFEDITTNNDHPACLYSTGIELSKQNYETEDDLYRYMTPSSRTW